jgi:hypothetical protein
VQRLTALWAFSECGLGGILHALQLPVTGLIVGGISIIMISFIAQLSSNSYKIILRSLLIVLIIKAAVSPYTPVTAYFAVSFQALTGYIFYRSMGIRFASVLAVGIVTMLESAIQHLLVLTLLFGRSFWRSMDEFTAFVSRQFNLNEINGTQWLISGYLLLYVAMGTWIAWLTWRMMNDERLVEENCEPVAQVTLIGLNKKRSHMKLWIGTGLLLIISAILIFIPSLGKQGWIEVVKAFCWTLTVISLWFLLVSPLLINLMKRFLLKKQKYYQEEVSETLSFLPVLRQLATSAWQKSRSQKSGNRWYAFINTLIQWTLVYKNRSEISHQSGLKS